MTRRSRPKNLVLLHRGSPDFDAIAKLRGRSPRVGAGETVLVTRRELEAARRAAASHDPDNHLPPHEKRWWLN